MIPEPHRKNFGKILTSASYKRLVLIECTDKQTGKPVYVLADVLYGDDANEVELTPFAKLFDGNPYEEVYPPGYEKEEDK